MNNQELPQLLLDHVLRDNYKPVKPRVIAKQLKLAAEDLPALKKAIKRLVRQGRLKYGPKHLVLRVEEPKPPTNTSRKRVSTADDTDHETAGLRETKRTKRPKQSKRADEVVGRFSRAAAGFGFVAVTPDFEKQRRRARRRHLYSASPYAGRRFR